MYVFAFATNGGNLIFCLKELRIAPVIVAYDGTIVVANDMEWEGMHASFGCS